MLSDFERLSQLMLDEFGRVHQRLDGFEERFNEFDRKFAAIDKRFDAIDARFASVEGRLTHIETELVSIHRRLDTLEDDVGSIKGFAKEIDALRDRIREIEKHLGISRKIAA